MNINIKVFYKLITSFLLAVARHVQSTQNNNLANSLQYLEKEGKVEVDFLHADKHIQKDNKSRIFKHLYSSATCFDLHNSLCFKIINKANSKFDLKINEALHINWRKPKWKLKCTAKSFSSHPFTIASVPLAPFCLCFSFVVFCISLSSIVFIISTLIISTFYCLNYTLLLPHLFMTHLVIDFVITT